ncbi:MAG: DUF3570 domain-containing protein [Methylococcaceae bacterium]
MAVINALAKKTAALPRQPKLKKLPAAIHSALINRPPAPSGKPAGCAAEEGVVREPPKADRLGKAPPSSLHALTIAALILPGLLPPPPAHAEEEDSVDFQYSHYQESSRNIYTNENAIIGGPVSVVKAPNVLNPIEVEGLHGSSRIHLTDRIKFAFNYIQDTWSGATPVASAPVLANPMNAVYADPQAVNPIMTGASPYLHNTTYFPFFIDKQGNRLPANYYYDPNTGASGYTPGNITNQVTDVLAGASPETRNQGDFKLGYDWDNASVTAGGGISVENDYDSRFGNLGTRLDFNQKRTSVNVDLSYTNSYTHATLDPWSSQFTLWGPYNTDSATTTSSVSGNQITYQSYSPLTEGTLTTNFSSDPSGKHTQNAYVSETVQGTREDWASNLGLTQVLTKNALLELGLGYTRSTGYLSNPYKAVYVFNAVQDPAADPNLPLLYSGAGQMESRPHERNMVTGHLAYQYFIEPLDAALHARYTVAHDNWNITGHTFDADWVQPVGAGWTVTPSVRYYSQSAANFYAPYFTTISTGLDPVTGMPIYTKALPDYYSSDQRLAGFGTLSGGVIVAKQFAKGVSLQAGFEYYTHQGRLKLGGGDQTFNNFDYWTANAALKINLGALRFGGGTGDAGSPPHHHAGHALTPAGIMFNHALGKAGDMMAGYRYMRSEQGGQILNGSTPVSPDVVKAQACGNAPSGCWMSPNTMTMNMHMLDLMYAPADWLTLMVMPQWVTMEMNMNSLFDPFTVMGGQHMYGGMGMGITNNQSGGVGDTGLYALFKLFEQPGHQVVLSLGGTAPTGDVAVMQRDNSPANHGPMDYSMQLGSGTWDLKPSLTYTGELQPFSWGVQLTGTHRVESKNASGYVLGDIFQTSLWGGYQWAPWLATTVRSLYTSQGEICGHFPDTADGTPFTTGMMTTPTAYTNNYGGQFVDLGLGVNVTVPGGAFAGNTIKFEWLQPLHTAYNGYQLDRVGALAATWSYGF